VKELIFKNHFNVKFAKLMTKWHLNFYLSGKGTPVSAGIYITDACNCRCIMCDLWKTKKPSFYPRDAQFKAIDALERMGCYYYSVSGGETTLVKDLPDRLSYAARKIPYVHVVTNGLTMTPELARALGTSGIDEISISIDGTEKTHNLLRGRADAFEKTWRALDLICTYAPKLHIVINSMLTPYNLYGLEELGERLESFPRIHQKYLPLTFHELFRNKQRQSISFPEEKASPSRMKSFIKKAIDNPRIINSPICLSVYYRNGF
jgi:MoaA/NifB/PqqE/SkfB family radical SAM enzyme